MQRSIQWAAASFILCAPAMVYANEPEFEIEYDAYEAFNEGTGRPQMQYLLHGRLHDTPIVISETSLPTVSKYHLLLSFAAAWITILSFITAWIASMYIVRIMGLLILAVSHRVRQRQSDKNDVLYSEDTSVDKTKVPLSVLDRLSRFRRSASRSSGRKNISSSESSWGSFYSDLLDWDSSTTDSPASFSSSASCCDSPSAYSTMESGEESSGSSSHRPRSESSFDTSSCNSKHEQPTIGV